tara:strand:+ start:2436 stop:3011 length:576 start_codon:yes stop_codon:yes gene_type:complete
MRTSLSKWTADNIGEIQKMNPLVRSVYLEFICRAAMSPLPLYLRITSGKRTPDEQYAEYLKGRPWLDEGTLGRKVTWVLCPRSWHCHGLALDIAPLIRLGTIAYSVWYKTTPFAELDKIARELFISHPWRNDKPHFHYANGFDDIDEWLAAGSPLAEPQFIPEKKPTALLRAMDRLGLIVDEQSHLISFPT